MSDEQKVNELLNEAAGLPEEHRADLARKLFQSLETDEFSAPYGELSEAWAKEIERRVKEIDNGEVEMLPWEEVRKRLWAKYES